MSFENNIKDVATGGKKITRTAESEKVRYAMESINCVNLKNLSQLAKLKISFAPQPSNVWKESKATTAQRNAVRHHCILGSPIFISAEPRLVCCEISVLDSSAVFHKACKSSKIWTFRSHCATQNCVVRALNNNNVHDWLNLQGLTLQCVVRALNNNNVHDWLNLQGLTLQCVVCVY